jgi:hypothetical protein
MSSQEKIFYYEKKNEKIQIFEKNVILQIPVEEDSENSFKSLLSILILMLQDLNY